MDAYTPFGSRSGEPAVNAPSAGGVAVNPNLNKSTDEGRKQLDQTASGNGGKAEITPELWRLDAPTRGVLRSLGTRLDGQLESTLDQFYRFMRGFPETAPHLADKGKIDCLKLLQKEHWRTLLKAGFDQDYLERVTRIGHAHNRVRLHPRYVFSGYAYMLEALVRQVLEASRRRPADAADQVAALIRVVMMEMEAVNSVYTACNNSESMLSNMQELAELFEHELDQAVDFVRRSALDMETAADAVLEAARKVSADGDVATAESENSNSNAQAIAAAAEELSSSIAEISRQVEHSTAAANETSQRSNGAQKSAQNLSALSERIGAIVKLIERIAKETRLLALNANIEAARAGEMGRGFAVVAHEVKTLADQTNKATGEIRSEIASMQSVIKHTVDSIGEVASKVEIATGDITAIAGAVTEQEAVTREIAKSASLTANGILTVHGRIVNVAGEAELSTREATKLREDTTAMVGQVLGIKRRVIATLRGTRFANRRQEERVAVDMPVVCQAMGKSFNGRLDNLSLGGAQVRDKILTASIKGDKTPITVQIDSIGSFQGVVVTAEEDAAHIHFHDYSSETKRKLSDFLEHCRREDDEQIALAKDSAAQIARIFEDGLKQRELTWDQLWDVDYRIIKDTDPPQFTTKFLAFCDQKLPAIQEPLLGRNARITFCAAIDRNGYLPTHNRKYSEPQIPGDRAWNMAHARNRRIFDDRTGLAAARNRQPVLVQIYRRDMGGGQLVSMKDISAPIFVNGQHWGGFRIGVRSARD